MHRKDTHGTATEVQKKETTTDQDAEMKTSGSTDAELDQSHSRPTTLTIHITSKQSSFLEQYGWGLADFHQEIGFVTSVALSISSSDATALIAGISEAGK